jgi:hypothetical protein
MTEPARPAPTVPAYPLPTPPPGQEERDRKRPVLHWSAVLGVVVFVAVAYWKKRPEAEVEATAPQYWLPFLVGGIVFVILISLAIAYAVYRLRRRSTFAGTVTFCVILALFTLTALNPSPRLQRRADAISLSLLEELRAKQHASQAGLDAFPAAGALTGAGIETPGQIETRIDSLDEVVRVNDEFIKAGDEAVPELERRLRAEGLPDNIRRMAAKNFSERFGWDYGRQAYVNSGRVLSIGRRVLVFLRDHSGEWHYVPEDGRLHFDSQDLIAEFDKLNAELQEAAQENMRMLRQQQAGRAAPSE